MRSMLTGILFWKSGGCLIFPSFEENLKKEKEKGETVKVLFLIWVVVPFGRFWFFLIIILLHFGMSGILYLLIT